MMFVRSASGFYTLRFLLGLAEAGFFPGIIFYLTRWFPARERARTIAAFMTATLIAGVIGGPISGTLLSLHGAGGLAGWQWLFLLEGLPSIVLGLVVLTVLAETAGRGGVADRRRSATTLVACLREDAAALRHETTGGALRNGRTWLLAIVYFTIPVTLYGIGFLLPQMLKSASGSSDFVVGLLSAIPYAAGAIAMVIVGRHSDRTGERRWHVLVPALVSAAGLRAQRGVDRHRVVGRDAVDRDARPRVDVRAVLGARDVDDGRRRRGGVDRAGQLGRQHRRLRRPVPARRDQRRDAQLRAAACWRSRRCSPAARRWCCSCATTADRDRSGRSSGETCRSSETPGRLARPCQDAFAQKRLRLARRHAQDPTPSQVVRPAGRGRRCVVHRRARDAGRPARARTAPARRRRSR